MQPMPSRPRALLPQTLRLILCALASLCAPVASTAAAGNPIPAGAHAAPAGAGDPDRWADGFEGDGVAAPAHWVGGYYVGYERNLYPIADVDFSAITHLMVGRLTPVADGTLTRHFDIDDVQGPIWAQRAIDAAHAARRRAILMIGGAGEVEGWRAAADDATRPTFVANLLDAVDEFDADGLDIDWEPLPPSDYADFIALAQALRAARPNLELTLPLGWVNVNFAGPPGEPAFLQTIAPLFDQINIMTYEMAAAYDGWHSWFASPLAGEAGNTPSSVTSSIDYYLDAGVPAAKLGVGIGFYGNCFRNVTQPRVPVALADFITSDGAMSYRNITTDYLPAMSQAFDAVAQAPWLSSVAQTGPRQCNFVTYENAASIAAKGAYVDDEGLGGTIIWTIGQGHIPGLPAGQRDPLLDAVRDAFLE